MTSHYSHGAFGVIPGEVEMPPPARPGLVVVIEREGSAAQAAAEAKAVDRPVRPGKQFDVTFRREE